MQKKSNLAQRLIKTLWVLPALLVIPFGQSGSSEAQNLAVRPPVSMRLISHNACELGLIQQNRLNSSLNAIRDVYQTKLGYAQAFEVPIKAHTFCSRSGFEAYKRQIGSRTSASTGFYSRSRQEIVVYHASEESTLQTLFHESSHALLRSQAARYPKWLNEGLAEYFEGAQAGSEPLEIQPQHVKEQRIQSLYLAGRMPSLESYLNQGVREWNQMQKGQPVASSMAWSLVYFLMEESQRQDLVRGMIQEHQHGKSALVAVEQTYPGGVAQLERDWHQWLGQSRQAHRWTPSA